MAQTGMEDEESIYELRRRLALLEWVTLAIVLAVLAFFAFVNVNLSFAIDRFDELFSDMLGDKPLPALTKTVIGCGRMGLPLFVSFFLPFGAAIFLFLQRTKGMPWVVSLCVISYLIIQAIVISVAMYMPMITIITELNGQN